MDPQPTRRSSTRRPPRLELPTPVGDEIRSWALGGYPRETCGLLVGQAQDGAIRVERAVSARNLNRERAQDRFELDPADHLRADDAARADGMEIVGVWHSHPDHPAQPSETDRAAAWEGWSYLIVSVRSDGVAEVRSWRLVAGSFVEEEIAP